MLLLKRCSGISTIVKEFKNMTKICVSTYSDEPSHRIEKTINNVTILGRVGADPQKRGNQEHPVVTFSLATHNNYRYENGDWVQKTDWHRVVVFKPALRDSVLQYLRKGQRTLVTGKITYGEINDSEGKSKVSTSIIADDVIFLQNTNTTGT